MGVALYIWDEYSCKIERDVVSLALVGEEELLKCPAKTRAWQDDEVQRP